MNNIVPNDQLATVWPQALTWLQEAIDRNQGDENSWDVFAALCQGRYWLIHEPGKYAGVFQVMKHPRQTVCTVLYAGGNDLDAMKATFEAGKEFCRANKIDVLRVWGRKGWQKLLGLERKGVILQVAIK